MYYLQKQKLHNNSKQAKYTRKTKAQKVLQILQKSHGAPRDRKIKIMRRPSKSLLEPYTNSIEKGERKDLWDRTQGDREVKINTLLNTEHDFVSPKV